MNFRVLGKTGFEISELSLGTWQIGGRWGEKFDVSVADEILNKAVDSGINFFDTADVYNDGKSEEALGRLIKTRRERIYIATKCGRYLNPHTNKKYTVKVLRKFVEDSLKRLGVETIDLIQLHCPPYEVYYRPEIFELFNLLKEEGKIQHLGVSVERVEEALKAIEFDNVTTVQIIFNMFRQRPAEKLFTEAKKMNVGIIARVPLASGLLTGTFYPHKKFHSGDHRNFNREGKYFDKGETFSGIEYETGLEAMNALREYFPDVDNLSVFALKWILMHNDVSCIIPGASRKEQLKQNLAVCEVDDLLPEQMEGVRKVYNEFIKDQVHQCW
jgi:aryl-alcohol dehydrogenase-like predicted oxidoreductase